MGASAVGSEVADRALAPQGQARVEWADREMPVVRAIRDRFERERPLAGVRIGACLHVTAETANLARALIAGGAELALCASNPLSTQDDVAAALVAAWGVEVHAVQGEDLDTYYRHIDAVVGAGPHVTLDDGADIISVIHARRADLAPAIRGATEATTSGVVRLRALEAQTGLAFPVIAVNESWSKRLLDNRYGTGQSTLDGIVRATHVLLAGRVVAVLGYGWCGQGIATRARGAGAQVLVCEVDPIRALEARLDGFEVLPGVQAARRADILITVTGGRDALSGEHFAVLRDGAILANAGHFDVEIDLEALRAQASGRRVVRPGVEQYELSGGRRVFLLAAGRVVNLAAAEGHPAEVMDIAFANQALAVEHLIAHGAQLEPRVYTLPPALDREIARLKLASLGVELDTLSAAQRAYLQSWDQGT